MLATEHLQIGDLQFTTTQLPAMRSLQLLTKLAKTVGPALGALMNLDPNTQLEDAGAGLTGALGTLDPSVAQGLVLEILAGTSVMGPDGRSMSLSTSGNVDLTFSAKLKMLFQVLGFVIKVNYRDFIEGSAPNAPQIQARSGS